MAWNARDRIRLEPKTKTNYWFSKYNRVLLHYSVSIDAAAATAADLTPSAQAAAAYSPRSAALRLFGRNTTVRTRTWKKTPMEYHTTPRTIKIIPQGQSSTFGHMTSLPVTSLSVTSHPVAMLFPVMRNGTYCTTTMVRKKHRNALPGIRRKYFRLWRSFQSRDFIWHHFQSGLLPVTSLPVTHA